MKPAYDPEKEELFHISGDEDHGIAYDANLTKTAFAKPQIRYDGKYGRMVMTADVYRAGNGKFAVHIICPSCRHALWIKPEVKAIEFDKEKGLSVETFECTWEKGRGTDETAADRIEFGVGLCRAKLAIDKNTARDA